MVCFKAVSLSPASTGLCFLSLCCPQMPPYLPAQTCGSHLSRCGTSRYSGTSGAVLRGCHAPLHSHSSPRVRVLRCPPTPPLHLQNTLLPASPRCTSAPTHPHSAASLLLLRLFLTPRVLVVAPHGAVTSEPPPAAPHASPDPPSFPQHPRGTHHSSPQPRGPPAAPHPLRPPHRPAAPRLSGGSHSPALPPPPLQTHAHTHTHSPRTAAHSPAFPTTTASLRPRGSTAPPRPAHAPRIPTLSPPTHTAPQRHPPPLAPLTPTPSPPLPGPTPEPPRSPPSPFPPTPPKPNQGGLDEFKPRPRKAPAAVLLRSISREGCGTGPVRMGSESRGAGAALSCRPERR